MPATPTRRSADRNAAPAGPPFLYHASFDGPDAEALYGSVPADADVGRLGYLSNEASHALAKHMHYAAWRAAGAARPREAGRWRRRYYEARNRIALGNLKLTFRAVQKWHMPPQLTDDLAADCQVVLIKAVAAFNPWLGIRFSTYAFTCLMRALSRLSQRVAADPLGRHVSLDALPEVEPSYVNPADRVDARLVLVSEFLREDHPRLTPREKTVLLRRFHPGDEAQRGGTLEEVGRELGLSKERVRQVQKSAINKLRDALLSDAAPI